MNNFDDQPVTVRCYEPAHWEMNDSPLTPPHFHNLIYIESDKAGYGERSFPNMSAAQKDVEQFIESGVTDWAHYRTPQTEVLFADLHYGRLLFRAVPTAHLEAARAASPGALARGEKPWLEAQK